MLLSHLLFQWKMVLEVESVSKIANPATYPKQQHFKIDIVFVISNPNNLFGEVKAKRFLTIRDCTVVFQ